MKFKLPKALLVALLAGTCACAEAVTETVVALPPTGARVTATETKDSSYTTSGSDTGSTYPIHFDKALKAENSTFSTERAAGVKISGAMYFHKTVEAKDCNFTVGNTNAGIMEFEQGVKLNGGNTFTSRGKEIKFSGDVEVYGDNTFIGGVRNETSFIVHSGEQTFRREGNPDANAATQNLVLKNCRLADDADEKAKINVSAVNVSNVEGTNKGGAYGNVTFSGECEISNLDIEIRSNTLKINGSLTIREKASIRAGQVVFGNENSIIIFEIDSIYELVERPDALMTLAGDSSPMLNVGDDVDMSDAKVELLFTEKALAELSAIEGPVTLNLEKVTNLENIELSLAVEESLGKSAEEVFGTTSVTTGAAGSAENQFTITVPEPTTATLSLLALASLAMRRRRK